MSGQRSRQARRDTVPWRGSQPGVCWSCEQPTGTRAPYCDDCRAEWYSEHDDEQAATETFRRDSFTCRACKRRFPRSRLRSDHIVPLWKDGVNELTNRQTLCIEHHDEKTGREEVERAEYEDARTRAREEVRVSAQALDDQPTKTATAKTATKAAATVFALPYGWEGVRAASDLVGDPVLPAVPGGPLWLAGTAALATVSLFAAHHSRRARALECARIKREVWEELAQVTRDADDDVDRLTVHEWGTDPDGETIPLDVTVRPGARFRPSKKGGLDALKLALAARTIPGARVDHKLAGGRVRLWLADDDEQPAETTPSTDEASAPPASVEEGAVAVRISDALTNAVGAPPRVEVVEWTEGQPTKAHVHYPARSTDKIQVGDLLAILENIYPPVAEHVWHADWEARVDRITFTSRRDPLAALVPVPTPVEYPDLRKGVAIGLLDDGSPWPLQLMGGAHVLGAGSTGAGKGSLAWASIAALEPMLVDRRARLFVGDPKGGAELSRLEDAVEVFAVTLDEHIAMLRRVRDEMMETLTRLRASRVREVITPSREWPFTFVILDELANITANADDPAKGKEVERLIRQILTMGRAPAYTVLALVQDPRKETVRMRAQFTRAIAMRLSEASETNLILNSGARAKGATADLIPEDLKGVGYAVADGKAGFLRGRLAFQDDAALDALAARLEAARREAPPITGPRGRGSVQPELPPAPPARRARPAGPAPVAPETPGPDEVVLAMDVGIGERVMIDDDPDPATILAIDDDEDEDREQGQQGTVLTFRHDGRHATPRHWFPADHPFRCAE